MPREEKFFDMFSAHSKTVVEAAGALRKLLNGIDVDANCERIVTLEDQADNITRDVLLAVRRSFITPFERGDIKDLIMTVSLAERAQGLWQRNYKEIGRSMFLHD